MIEIIFILNSLWNNKITSKGASLLFNALKEYNKSIVEKIYLSGNELDDDCMKSLGEFIKNNQTIININIGYKITDKGIEILLPYLIGNITIKKINIYGNKGITDKSVPLLIEIIQKSNIQDINIYETSITEVEREKIELELKIPIDQREIPLITIGNVKSASKIS